MKTRYKVAKVPKAKSPRAVHCHILLYDSPNCVPLSRKWYLNLVEAIIAPDKMNAMVNANDFFYPRGTPI
jgi:hypothetical protein